MIIQTVHPEAFMTSIHSVLRLIRGECPDITILENEPLSAHTSFKIGGPAALMAFPKSEQELARLFRAAKAHGVRPRILGAGTNVLAPDNGLDELLICTKEALCGLSNPSENTIEVMAGESMAKAAVYARELGLSGFEFAHGIPGTLGGGVYMNAGAYGAEIKDVCQSVTVMDFDGNLREYKNIDIFSYRNSIFQSLDCIIVSARFVLTPAEECVIREKMQELMERRRASQPLEYPSAGSTFKRPDGAYAGALIEGSNLKGVSVGGAQVSPKHAGFVINCGGAPASDVMMLIEQIQKKVYADSGFMLEPEVRIW